MNKISLFVIAVMLLSVSANAQGGMQRRTVEERVAAAHQKIDSAFKPDAAKFEKIDAAFTTYYKASDKVREELMSGGGRPDREVMQAKMLPLTEARDKDLKAAFGEADFKKFKEEVEPALNPRRGGPGGPGGRP
ncbi:MAG: hypothetical protein EOO09_08345 [Chitinophagaceae bacterium]|nr:MAG: hypothetical protein EOO09_08345 [Chitinophagaceae bacterium]